MIGNDFQHSYCLNNFIYGCIRFCLQVRYECLAEEIKIGDYYLRLLLEEDENEESSAIKRSWELRYITSYTYTIYCSALKPKWRFHSSHSLRYEFFNELYHRFLLTPKVTMKCLCLQALTIVYGKCYEEIGPFTDTKYIVGMLDRVSIFWHWGNKWFDAFLNQNALLVLQCTDKLERDRLILFLNKLILNKVSY